MDGDRPGVERIARDSYGKLLAYLATRMGIDAAQDALADAFASALETWPRDGVPQRPEAWLLTTARNRFIDGVRRSKRETRALDALATNMTDAYDAFASDRAADERLAMLFACAHPAIGESMRAPLMLQVVLGIDAARISSAFLVAPATMGQRLVRAKRKIVDAGIPLRVPDPQEFPTRLAAVLDAIYAAFSEGWDDPAGVDRRSRGLADEAMWLGRLVVDACPGEPEALGLLALMLYAHSRRNARRSAAGAFVPLDAQDVSLWDRAMIDEAEELLRRAARVATRSRFQIEAAIQSAHAVRRYGESPDWSSILALYEALFDLTRSPVVALNRAIAVSHVHGPAAALEALDAIADARLTEYQPYWASRAEVLALCGEKDDASEAFQRAIGLTIDPAVRDFLARRAHSLLRVERSGENHLLR